MSVQYAPLSGHEIRPLNMTARREDGPHEGEPEPPKQSLLKIEHFKLRTPSCPPFLALSYVWGDPTEKTNTPFNLGDVQIPINLDNALDRIYDISQTLLAGISASLKMLETDNPSIYIWADLVYINQTDIAERSHQVPRMKDIYSSAYSVIVWLNDFLELAQDTKKTNSIRRLLMRDTTDTNIVHSLLVELMGIGDPDGFPKTKVPISMLTARTQPDISST